MRVVAILGRELVHAAVGVAARHGKNSSELPGVYAW
jgi:hypothetical protein